MANNQAFHTAFEESAPISELINIDTNWLRDWYSEEDYLHKVESIQLSLVQSILQFACVQGNADCDDFGSIRLEPNTVEQVVLNMESFDSTHKIDGFDRYNVLFIFRQMCYAPDCV